MNTNGKQEITAGRIIVGYVRVSTSRQGETGVSLDAQRDAIRAFADELRIPVLEIFEDVATGYGRSSLRARQGLKRALEACRDRDAILVVWDWSRLSRDADVMRDLRELLPAPDRIRSVKENEDLARATEQGRFARAQHEREKISERTRDALARKKQDGKVLGNPYIDTVQPIGAATFKMQSDALVRRIVDALADIPGSETMTTAEIARELNMRGLRTGHGREWNKTRLRLPLQKARALIADDAAAVHEANPNFGLF